MSEFFTTSCGCYTYWKVDDLCWLILLDKDLKSSGPPSSAKLLTYDFIPSMIDDVDCVKWMMTLTVIIKVVCIYG